MLTSKVSSKGQVTIPAEVRERLGIREGDTLLYEIAPSGVVTMAKVRPFGVEWHQAVSATLATEWNSQEDEEDFAELQNPNRVRRVKK